MTPRVGVEIGLGDWTRTPARASCPDAADVAMDAHVERKVTEGSLIAVALAKVRCSIHLEGYN